MGFQGHLGTVLWGAWTPGCVCTKVIDHRRRPVKNMRLQNIMSHRNTVVGNEQIFKRKEHLKGELPIIHVYKSEK